MSEERIHKVRRAIINLLERKGHTVELEVSGALEIGDIRTVDGFYIGIYSTYMSRTKSGNFPFEVETYISVEVPGIDKKFRTVVYKERRGGVVNVKKICDRIEALVAYKKDIQDRSREDDKIFTKKAQDREYILRQVGLPIDVAELRKMGADVQALGYLRNEQYSVNICNLSADQAIELLDFCKTTGMLTSSQTEE